jgi:anti-sigma regulatory factor (Ser/Thr protein kinase)
VTMPTRTAVLELCPEAVRAARELIVATVPDGARWSLDDALLCASELVSNAVCHGVGPLEVRVQSERDWVRVEVEDRAPRALPERLTPDGAGFDAPPPLATAGRGLFLVEQLADRWDVERADEAKVVWFELGHRGGAER